MYEDQQPEWLQALKWLGVALAIGLGIGYYFFAGSPSTTKAAPTATTPEVRVDQPAATLTSGQTPLFATLSPQSGAAAPMAEVKVGAPAPDFSLPTLDGQTAKLSGHRGQPVLVNFWATWCALCRIEMPEIERAYKKYNDNGFIVLAVNLTFQEVRSEVGPYRDELGLTFPILLDLDGHVTDEVYRVLGLPTSVFVARDGTFTSLRIGMMTRDDLEQRLAEIR